MDGESIALSRLAECVYCHRLWYLKSLERLSNDNVFIIDGRIEHEEVHSDYIYADNDRVSVTNLLVYSNNLSLMGVCDLVEFESDFNGVRVPYCDYRVKVSPVEYKRGKIRKANDQIAQVTAQAMCLEEMYDCRIDTGYIYYTESGERLEIDISRTYRDVVSRTIDFIKHYNYEYIKPAYSRKCRGCSMFEICSPRELNIDAYLNVLWKGDDISSI